MSSTQMELKSLVMNTDRAANCFQYEPEQKNLINRVASYVCGNCIKGMILQRPQLSKKDKMVCEDFLNSEIPDLQHPDKAEIWEHFAFSIEKIEFDYAGNTYEMRVTRYVSQGEFKSRHVAMRIGGAKETQESSVFQVYPYLGEYLESESEEVKLDFISVSLYGHTIKKEGQIVPWWPSNMNEMSRVFLELIHHLHDKGTTVHSLICHSLGSAMLEALKDIPSENHLPKVLILDRAMSSTWKVARKLYCGAAASVLYGLAKLTGWDADPEESITQFYSRQVIYEDQKLIVIEVEDDFYFAGQGALAPNFTDDLSRQGLQTFRKEFRINKLEYHERAAHSFPHLYNDGEASTNEVFPIQPYQSVPNAIVQYVFLQHTDSLVAEELD